MRLGGDTTRTQALMLAGLCGLAPASARAACEIRAVVGPSFLNYTSLPPLPLDSTGSVTFRCTAVQTTPITIDLSEGSSGSYATRHLQGPSSTPLEYNLFLDATYLSIWGDGLSGTSRYGPVVPPLDEDITVTIYGRIPAQQSVVAGAYSDTVVVTLNF
ncbi:Csu type fimbrial protein [Myxococcus qinghaiensis]|uniref:Csu type fimbrial protein n=1 Tax=Myxococcus qinghaiensis TaxID=2906758 RepID=UPI0020A70633|nr:spore coat U domain-containing protein [Myxococcus qinghaiensis]MCP3168262.1 spore coat U domain-containing protein [Myxococcus qinghaiensis]